MDSSEFVQVGVAGREIHEEHLYLLIHPVKLHANHAVQSVWDPRDAQKQKSGHIGGCIIHKLYLLQGRGTPSYIFVCLCCTASRKHQIIVISVLFSEHVRNLRKHSLRNACNHSSELSAYSGVTFLQLLGFVWEGGLG